MSIQTTATSAASKAEPVTAQQIWAANAPKAFSLTSDEIAAVTNIHY